MAEFQTLPRYGRAPSSREIDEFQLYLRCGQTVRARLATATRNSSQTRPLTKEKLKKERSSAKESTAADPLTQERNKDLSGRS